MWRPQKNIQLVTRSTVRPHPILPRGVIYCTVCCMYVHVISFCLSLSCDLRDYGGQLYNTGQNHLLMTIKNRPSMYLVLVINCWLRNKSYRNITRCILAVVTFNFVCTEYWSSSGGQYHYPGFSTHTQVQNICTAVQCTGSICVGQYHYPGFSPHAQVQSICTAVQCTGSTCVGQYH